MLLLTVTRTKPECVRGNPQCSPLEYYTLSLLLQQRQQGDNTGVVSSYRLAWAFVLPKHTYTHLPVLKPLLLYCAYSTVPP